MMSKDITAGWTERGDIWTKDGVEVFMSSEGYIVSKRFDSDEEAFRYGNELCASGDEKNEAPEGWTRTADGIYTKGNVILLKTPEGWAAIRVESFYPRNSIENAVNIGEALCHYFPEVQTLKATSTKALDEMVNAAFLEGWKLDTFFQDETGGYCQRMIRNG